jgi:hypothetical protein
MVVSYGSAWLLNPVAATDRDGECTATSNHSGAEVKSPATIRFITFGYRIPSRNR